MSEAAQLAALARLHALFAQQEVEYWVFGGWAVDFHAGAVTRAHDDLDVAIWFEDRERIAAMLASDGWWLAPEPDADGYVVYKRDGVRLEVAFLARDENGEVYTPLREGRGSWPEASFEGHVAELRGVRAQVMSLRALRTDKSVARDDASAAAKDRADVASLAALG